MRAESDDFAAFSDSLHEDIISDWNISKKDYIYPNHEKDSDKGKITLKTDENGKKRAPNLFLFKRRPKCVPNLKDSCKQRNIAHSQFMLVDTIYRDTKAEQTAQFRQSLGKETFSYNGYLRS